MKKASHIDPNELFAGVDEMPVALDHNYEQERADAERRKQSELEVSFPFLYYLKTNFPGTLGLGWLLRRPQITSSFY